MDVILDRERLKAPLPDMSGSAVSTVMAADVRRQQPVHPGSKFTISAGFQNEMKMVGHQTICQYPNFLTHMPHGKQLDKCRVVLIAVEHLRLRVPTVHDVVDHFAH